jgi:DNA-binding CsgD family transcriptional regulator
MSPQHGTYARQFARLANAAVDLATLPDQLLDALARVVSFDSYCWAAIDPRSLLPTGKMGTTLRFSSPVLWEEQELIARNREPGDLRSMARCGRSVALLSQIFGERKDESLIYRRVLRPNGLEHQLRGALAVDGVHWGQLHIERRADRPDFSSSEVALVEEFVPHIAHAFRRWLLAEPGATSDASPPALPGVIVLDEHYEVDSISPEAEHWLGEWGLSDLKRPPVAITAVVGAAHARAAGCADAIPSARLRVKTGAWLHVRATHLARPDRKPCTALVLERAAPDQVAPLIARANQLTARETEIAMLVLRGRSTSEIAAELFISPYTVQDHLKSIFEKVGVRSRRELATEIFEPHCQAA